MRSRIDPGSESNRIGISLNLINIILNIHPVALFKSLCTSVVKHTHDSRLTLTLNRFFLLLIEILKITDENYQTVPISNASI